MKWKPISRNELNGLLREEVSRLDEEQMRLWKACRIEPKRSPIERYGNEEQVFVVALRNGEAIYYEDVEEGFNVSPIGSDGRVLEHWCDQDELRWALDRWLRAGHRCLRCGPAESFG